MLSELFNGLKKIVSGKVTEEPPVEVITPDVLLTPCLTRSCRKRKIENSFSSKKRYFKK